MNATVTQAGHSVGPAEIYDRSFVPALFARWGFVVTEAARVRPGDRALDIACGTGALTLAAAETVGPSGAVVGLDPNPEMLAVARAKPMPIEWREGRAENLPFSHSAFDVVVSQFGIMFFDDPRQAFSEMRRVLRPGGRIAVAVFDNIKTAPGYDALANLLDRLFGGQVGDAMRAPFTLGDADRLGGLARASFPEAMVTQHHGSVRFASVRDLIETEHACIWTLGGLIDEAQAIRLRQQAERELSGFVAPDGSIEFSMPALIVTAERSG